MKHFSISKQVTGNQQLRKTLLAATLVAAMAMASQAYAGDEKQKAKRMYVDPVTGETKQATKLLSEMTDTEKALLSNEEYRALKELEAKLEEEKAKAAGE